MAFVLYFGINPCLVINLIFPRCEKDLTITALGLIYKFISENRDGERGSVRH